MKKYFLIIIIFAMVTFIMTGIMASKERNENGEDFLKYKQLINEVQNNKKYEEALEYIDYMQEKEKEENYVFNLEKADIYSKMKEYKKASQEYEKASKINKSLEKNIAFLLNYSQTLIDSKEKEKALELIYRAEDIGIPENMVKKYNETLKKLK